MSLFKNLKSDGLEETRDSLGGSFIVESGAYAGKIKYAYAQPAASGALGIVLCVALEGGRDYTETLYVTNKSGDNFFLNKNDNSKKVPLPGFVIIDDLCQVVAGKPLSEMDTEEKMVNVWDSDLKKEVPKSVPMLVDLIGQDTLLGIIKKVENKSVKDDNGNYIPTAETRELNNIDKVFHAELKLTVPEARNGKDTPEFYDAWVDRNAGKTQNRVKDVAQGTARAPAKPGAPAAAGAPARQSLFGKK